MPEDIKFNLSVLQEIEKKVEDAVVELLDYTGSNGFDHEYVSNNYSSIKLNVTAEDN